VSTDINILAGEPHIVTLSNDVSVLTPDTTHEVNVSVTDARGNPIEESTTINLLTYGAISLSGSNNTSITLDG
jgi:hypothetical protein